MTSRDAKLRILLKAAKKQHHAYTKASRADHEKACRETNRAFEEYQAIRREPDADGS